MRHDDDDDDDDDFDLYRYFVAVFNKTIIPLALVG